MKNKAFTLTELLVVVVIIGTLSAVVLPKFTKVIETRRTGEAEEIMAAVRTEQEARCTLDKTYTAQAKNLHSLEGVEGNQFAYGKNYQFTLNDTGMTAARKGKDYQLKMKSYADGGLCCEGNYCEKLNKSYPACSEYNPTVLSGCAVPPSGEENQVLGGEGCDATHQEGDSAGRDTCDCGTYTYKKWTCNTATKTWEIYEDKSACRNASNDKNSCEHEDGTWDATKCECTPKTSCDITKPAIAAKKRLCDDPDEYYYEGTWDMDECDCDCGPGRMWNDDLGCVCDYTTSENMFKAQNCEQGANNPNWVAGTWNNTSCSCTCPPGSKLDEEGACVPECDTTFEYGYKDQECESGHGGRYPSGTWDNEKCDCICPQGTTLDRRWYVCVPECDVDNDSALGVKMQDCEQPRQNIIWCESNGVTGGCIYDTEPGTWSMEECKCICPDDQGKYTYEYKNGYCYLKCKPEYHGDEQSRDECANGTGSDRAKGIAVHGYWNEYICGCVCPTNYGAKERKDAHGVYACYRDNCETAEEPSGGWSSCKAGCELTGPNWHPCGDGSYYAGSGSSRDHDMYCAANYTSTRRYKGQWNAEKCQCNCPQGTKLDGCQCRKNSKAKEVDVDHFYDGGEVDYDDTENPEHDFDWFSWDEETGMDWSFDDEPGRDEGGWDW